MKIAIYGDSHVANFFDPSLNNDVSYIELLCRKYNIDNYGKGGSSLFFSYHEFLNSHESYDRVIFVATNPGRFYIDAETNPTLERRHMASIGHVEDAIRSFANDINHLTVFKAIRDYMLYAQNNKEVQTFHDLMLADIKLKRPDVILFDRQKYQDTDFNFWNIHNEQVANVYDDYTDVRHCHLSKEKHLIFYEMLEDSLSTGDEIDYNKLLNVKPSKSFEQYFLNNNQDIQYIPFDEYKLSFV